jgi:cytoskeletal protein CcmA (bactofilin family)
MFSRENHKLETLIGAKSNFRGELNVEGTLRVDGRVDGRLNADWVILGETGIVKGEITAKRIIVGGKVEGNLRGLELVEIKASGKVLGDILTHKFSITEGGEFNGKIEMKSEPEKALEFEAKPQEA